MEEKVGAVPRCPLWLNAKVPLDLQTDGHSLKHRGPVENLKKKKKKEKKEKEPDPQSEGARRPPTPHLPAPPDHSIRGRGKGFLTPSGSSTLFKPERNVICSFCLKIC